MHTSYDNHRVVILSLAGNVQKLVIFGGKCPEIGHFWREMSRKDFIGYYTTRKENINV